MSRPQLTPLSEYRFEVDFVLRVGDVNYANHFSHDAAVSLLHDARVSMFRELGFTELDLGDGSTGIVMTDLTIGYTAEAFVADELRVESGIREITRSSYRVHQRMWRGDVQVALSEAGQAAFDYTSRKLTRFPEGFLTQLRAHASSD